MYLVRVFSSGDVQLLIICMQDVVCYITFILL